MTVTFRTVLVGGSGGTLVLPLKYRLNKIERAPKVGVTMRRLTEDYGSTTTVDNDARVRIRVSAPLPAAGIYDIALCMQPGEAYLNPPG